MENVLIRGYFNAVSGVITWPEYHRIERTIIHFLKAWNHRKWGHAMAQGKL